MSRSRTSWIRRMFAGPVVPSRTARRATHARLGVEGLEDRTVPDARSSALFNGVAASLTSEEKNFLGNSSVWSSTVPIVGSGLGAANSAIKSKLDDLIGRIQALGNMPDVGRAIAGLQQLPEAKNVRVVNGDAATGEDVRVVTDFALSDVDFQTFSYTKTLGSGSLPFKIETEISGVLRGQISLRNVDFGLANNTGYRFNNTAKNPTNVSVTASAAINNTQILNGHFGLFAISATPGPFQPTGPNPTGIGVQLAFSSDLYDNGLLSPLHFNKVQAALSFDINGTLDPANLGIQGVDVAKLPSIGASVHTSWDSTGTTIASIDVGHIKVDLGSVLSTALSPVLDFVHSVAAPIQPALDALTAKLPGFEKIGVDISLLDLAKVANAIGVVPPGWKELIGLGADLVDLLSSVQNLKIGSGSAVFDVGNLTFRGAGGGFSAVPNVNAQNFTAIVNSLPAGARSLLKPLSDRFNALNNNGVHINFPIVEDPLQGVLSLLEGRDAKLVTLNADYDADGGGSSLAVTGYEGIGLDFNTNVFAHVHIHAGYDTKGIRDFLNPRGTAGPKSLLNGLYVESSVPLLDVGGSASVGIGLNYYVIRGDISGGVDGRFTLSLNSNGTGVVRPFGENPTQLFNLAGELDAFVHAGLYIDLVVYKKEILGTDLSRTPLLSISSIDPANPLYQDVGTYPLFGAKPPQEESIDLDKNPPSDPSGPDLVTVSTTTRNNSTYLVAQVNAVTYTYKLENVAHLTITGSSRDAVYTIDTDRANLVINGGSGHNSLLFDSRESTWKPGFDYHITSTGIRSVTHPDDHGFGGRQVNLIAYKNMGDMEFIAPARDDSISVDSLPAGALHLVTAAYRASGGGKFGQTSSSHPMYDDYYGSPTATNTIYLNADLIRNNHGLSVSGYSPHDAIVIQDGYSGTTKRFAKSAMPTYDFYSNTIRSTLPQPAAGGFGGAGGGGALGGTTGTGTFFIPGGLSFDGIESVQVSVTSTSTTPVSRFFNVHDWNTAVPLTLAGSAAGADTFTIGDGNLDLGSTTSGPTRFITIQGDARDTVIFDDSRHADLSVFDAAGNPLGQETNATAWNVTGTQLTRTNALTDPTGAVTAYSRGVRFAGVGTVRVLGGSGDDTFTYTPSGATTRFDLNGGLGSDTLVIDNSAVAAGDYTVSAAGITGIGSNITHSGMDSVVLQTGSGNDRVTVTATAPGTSLTVLSGGGDDTFDVDLGNLGGPLHLDGGAGYNYLYVDDTNPSLSSFVVTADILSSNSTDVPVYYSDFNDLLVTGTAADDNFYIDSTAPGTRLTLWGREGYDGYYFGYSTGTLDGIQGSVVVYDTFGQGLVMFEDINNPDPHTYALGPTAGSPLAFQRDGMASVDLSLYGDPTQIAFLYLDTGRAADSVSIQALPTEYWSVNNLTGGDGLVVGSDPTGQSGTLDNVRGTVDVHSTDPVTVVVDDSADTTARDVYVENGVYNDPENVYVVGLQPASMTFNVAARSNVLLRGGQGDDRFRVINDAGVNPVSVDAGGGVDTLDYSWSDNYYTPFVGGVYVDLDKGQATGLNLAAGFEDVVGSVGDDVILGNSADNLLVGNGGNDRLVGRAGNDILIGGYGNDILDGGAGSDLLIGGATAYDSYFIAYFGADNPMYGVQKEWSRTDQTYAQKVAHITGDVPGGWNGTVFLTGGQVDSTGQTDSLTGGAGLDWFLAPRKSVKDVTAGERVL